MRILHISDVHLDRPFSGFAYEDARARRAEVWSTFKRCLELAKERDADLLTIGGDLWENENVVPNTRQSVADELERLGLPVLIVAGNHDPLLPGGHYEQTRWPDNVHVFGGGPLQERAFDEVSVWGVSWTSGRLTADFLNTFHTPDDGRSHLLLIHGSSENNPHYLEAGAHCPFAPSAVASAGFAGVLCGHIHRASFEQGVIYPGSPEPLRFVETGRHCAAVIDLDRRGDLEVELVPVNRRTYHQVSVDCTSATSSAEVGSRVAAAAGADDIDPANTVLIVDLTGGVQPEVVIDTAQLAQELPSFEYVEMRDKTRAAWDFESLALHPTADGRFVAKLLAQLETEDDEYERQVIEKALDLGLRAMNGQEVPVDVG